MKRKLFASTLLILGVILFGCSSNPSVSDHSTTSVSARQPVVTQGYYSISVYGANPKSSLTSVDFVDATTGWVARNNNTTTQSSQILKTQDGGVSWQTTALYNSVIEQLRFVDKTTGWAIGHFQTNSNGQPSTMKILHTQDGGQNWDVQWEDKLDSASGDKLWFQDLTHGYALIGGALLMTQDGGKQWSPVAFNVTGFTPQHMNFVNAAAGWVIGVIKQQASALPTEQNSIYKLVVLHTVDAGKHWQRQFTQEYPKGEGPSGSVDIDFVNGTTGWFLTSNFATMSGDLYYTSNAGKQWQKINEVTSARPTPTEIRFITPKVGWIPLDVGAGPISGGLLFTKDGGKNFTRVGSDTEMNSVRAVDFVSAQQGWAVGTAVAMNQEDYLVRTTDGGQTWTQVYPRLSPAQDISFVDNQHGFGLGELADPGAVLHTADGGDTWQKIYSFGEQYRPSVLSFVNRNQGWILATPINPDADKTVMLHTTDGGNSWTTVTGDIPQIQSFRPAFFRFFDADNAILVTQVADNFEVYRTKDSGRTWQESITEHSKGYISQYSFVSLTQGWEISATGTDQPTVNLSHLPDGSGWQDMGGISSNAWPCGIAFSSKDVGHIILQEPALMTDSRFQLLTTTDGGRSWSAHLFPSGLQLDMQYDQMPMQFTDDQHGWILSAQGLLRTQDGGRTWSWEQGSEQG